MPIKKSSEATESAFRKEKPKWPLVVMLEFVIALALLLLFTWLGR